MTKREIVYLVWGILDPSQSSKRWHYNTIMYGIEQAYNQYVQSIPNYLYEEHEFLVKEFFSQAVTLDTDRNLYYTNLPASLVPMNPPSEAVRHVGTNEGISLDFAPCDETTWELMDGLFSHDTDFTIDYIVRNDKIWYQNMTSDIAEEGVRLVLAVRFSEFGDTDIVNLPGGSIDIIQSAVQFLMNTQPMDQKNNNAK
jgi:hypothetical protein